MDEVENGRDGGAPVSTGVHAWVGAHGPDVGSVVSDLASHERADAVELD